MTPIAVVVITLAAIVLIGLVAVVTQRNRESRQAQTRLEFQRLNGIPVGTSAKPPRSSFIRYGDPTRRTAAENAAAERIRLQGSREMSQAAADAATAASATAAQRAAAKAAAAKAAQGSGAGETTADVVQNTPASDATPSTRPFSPIGRWVKQDGSGTYVFFRADGISYESDGRENNASAESFPDSAHWIMQTDGAATVVDTGSNRYVVAGADTLHGEDGGTYIRVGE